MRLLSFVSYWRGLFTIEAAEGGDDALSFLPFLITAIAAGVILASAYYIFWRAFEAALLRRLHSSGADCAANGKTLTDLGYRPGSFSYRFARFLLRSPSCILYKTISNDEQDARRTAVLTGQLRFDKQDKSVGKAETDGMIVNEGTGADETPSMTPPDSEENKKQARRKEKNSIPFRMALSQDTRFYILPTRLSYVEENCLKFSRDAYMGLLYTTVACAFIWFVLLNCLDPFIGFLMGGN